jgi:hypothetical protein
MARQTRTREFFVVPIDGRLIDCSGALSSAAAPILPAV